MKFEIEHKFDLARNRHFLNGFNTVLHCHHYTTLTTQLAFDAVHFDGEKILFTSSEDSFYNVLDNYFRKQGVSNSEDKIKIAEDYWRLIGMGLISIKSAASMTAQMEHSHVDEGWLKKWGSTTKPVNVITAGFIAAVASHVYGKPAGSYSVTQTKSIAAGDAVSSFEATLRPSAVDITKLHKISAESRQPMALSLSMKTNVDRLKIIEDLSKISVMGDENGMIPAFGVFIQQFPADFWNGFAQRLIRNVSPEMIETTESLLVNCAHECGYHTGHGIITSSIWNENVAPMIKDIPEDILHGAFAVFTAWGWAMCEIVELIPAEIMVLRAYDYYESDVKTDRMSSYLIQGVSSAFMDLAYGGKYDSTGKIGLRTFSCKQTKGIEVGDEYGEFIVSRTKV